MSFVKYVVKTSVADMLRDWREYKALKDKKFQMEHQVEDLHNLLVRHYSLNEDMTLGRACIKSKELVPADGLMDLSPCRFFVLRCPYFAPVDNEELCEKYTCPEWQKNKNYNQKLQQYNDLSEQCAAFWNKKFANVK